MKMMESSKEKKKKTIVKKEETGLYKQYLFLFPTQFTNDLYCRHVRLQVSLAKG